MMETKEVVVIIYIANNVPTGVDFGCCWVSSRNLTGSVVLYSCAFISLRSSPNTCVYINFTF